MWISAVEASISSGAKWKRSKKRVYLRTSEIESFGRCTGCGSVTMIRTRSGDIWYLFITIDELGELIEQKLKEEIIIR